VNMHRRRHLLWGIWIQAAHLVLMNLEPEARVDCVKRMATMRQYSPEAAFKRRRWFLKSSIRVPVGDQFQAIRFGIQKCCGFE